MKVTKDKKLEIFTEVEKAIKREEWDYALQELLQYVYCVGDTAWVRRMDNLMRQRKPRVALPAYMVGIGRNGRGDK